MMLVTSGCHSCRRKKSEGFVPHKRDRHKQCKLGIKFHRMQCLINFALHTDCVKPIWYLSPMRAAKVQVSLRIRAVSPDPLLLIRTSSESRGTFRQKGRSLASLNGWACAVKICHEGMLEDTNSLDGAHTGISVKIIGINQIALKQQMSQLMRLWYLSHRRPAKAQARQFAHMKNGSRRRVRPKIRLLALLDACNCTFEE